jgi:hypothetical protein
LHPHQAGGGTWLTIDGTYTVLNGLAMNLNALQMAFHKGTSNGTKGEHIENDK